MVSSSFQGLRWIRPFSPQASRRVSESFWLSDAVAEFLYRLVRGSFDHCLAFMDARLYVFGVPSVADLPLVIGEPCLRRRQITITAGAASSAPSSISDRRERCGRGVIRAWAALPRAKATPSSSRIRGSTNASDRRAALPYRRTRARRRIRGTLFGSAGRSLSGSRRRPSFSFYSSWNPSGRGALYRKRSPSLALPTIRAN